MTQDIWSPTPRQVRWLLLAALLPFLVIVVATWSEPPAATDGDYAHYLLHAKAIAEGRAFEDIGYIYTRMNLVGPSLQPPGWPLVLAPFVAVFGTSLDMAKALVTLLVAAFGIATGIYFVRRGQPIVGIAATTAAPVALMAQYANSSALSDPLFCFLVWMMLLVADAEGPFGWRQAVALGVLSLAVLSVRVAGLAVLPALLLFAWFRQRDGRWKLLAPLAAVAVAFLLVLWIGFDRIPFHDRIANGLRNFSFAKLASTYVVALATGALYPFDVNVADDFYHLVAAIPMVIGLVVFARRQYRSALACFTLAYICVLLVAPVHEPRYAWPLIPLVMAWVTIGLLWLGTRYAPAGLRADWPKFVLTFVGVVAIGASIHVARRPARWSFYGDPDTMALFDWARTAGDSSGMRIVFTNPRVLTLETGVPSMGIPNGEAEDVLAEMDRQRITHVVIPLEHVERSSERKFREYVEARPAQFPEVFANETYDVRRFIARSPSTAPDSGPFAVTRQK